MTINVTHDTAPQDAAASTTAPLRPPTASVVDIAEYMLSQHGEMSTEKLQALMYLSQAWSLGITGRPIFHEEIQAWAEGPIIPALYTLHDGETTVGPGFFYEKLRAQAASKMSVVTTNIEVEGGTR
jgi:uncharacterized phage-associated protein